MAAERLHTYLVEIEPRDAAGVGSVASRARLAAKDTRFLRSIYVPENDRSFLLYEGASVTEVAAAAERAHAKVVSIAVARDVPADGAR